MFTRIRPYYMSSYDVAVYAESLDQAEEVSEGLSAANYSLNCVPVSSREEIFEEVEADFFVNCSLLESQEDLRLIQKIMDERPELSFVQFIRGGDSSLIGEAVKLGLDGYVVGELGDEAFNKLSDAINRELHDENWTARMRYLRKVFDRVSDAIYLKDENRVYQMVNEATADLYGVEPKYMIGKKDKNFFDDVDVFRDKDVREIREDDRKVIEEGAELSGWSRREVNGEEEYFLYSKTPYRDEKGDIKGVIGVSRNVTKERKKSRRIEAIFNNSENMIAFADKDGNILKVNDTTENILECGRDELEGAKFGENEIFFPREKCREMFQKAVDGDPVSETTELEIDGELRIMEVTVAPIRDSENKIKSVIIETHDITEMKKSEQQLSAAFDSSHEMIGLINSEGKIVRVNRAVEEFFDVEAEEIVGKDYKELKEFIDYSRLLKIYERLLSQSFFETIREKGFYRDTITVEKDSGKTATLDFTIKTMEDKDGELQYLLVEAKDVTETKMNRRQLEDQKKRLERFSSMVSHDLRNPLNVASGYLELARDSGREEDFEKAMNAIERMDEIINELLEISGKPEHFRDEEIELEKTFNEAYSFVEANPDYTVEDSRELRAGRSGVIRLFENLIKNTVEHNDGAEIRVGTMENGFFYEDTGELEEDIDDALEYGYSSSRGGTGLGLSVVQRVAEINDWDLNATKTESGGLRFEFLVED